MVFTLAGTFYVMNRKEPMQPEKGELECDRVGLFGASSLLL
jgi:hypothetical protein